MGRKYTDEDELLTDDDDNLSSDDDEEADKLNNQIAELRRMLGSNERILKGDDGEDIMKETEGDLDALDDDVGDKKDGITAAEKKKQQRDEDQK